MKFPGVANHIMVLLDNILMLREHIKKCSGLEGWDISDLCWNGGREGKVRGTLRTPHSETAGMTPGHRVYLYSHEFLKI